MTLEHLLLPFVWVLNGFLATLYLLALFRCQLQIVQHFII